MTTLADVYEAGVDAVIADNTISRGDFSTAMRTVATTGVTLVEANAFMDALATFFNAIGLINNPTYNNLRGEIINEGKVTALAQFDALASPISLLPETTPLNTGIALMDLRTERDEVQTSVDRMVVLKGTESRQVKDALNLGIDQLRGYKEDLRTQIQNLTGDGDS